MRNCELLDVYVTVTHKIMPNKKNYVKFEFAITKENVTPLFFHLM